MRLPAVQKFMITIEVNGRATTIAPGTTLSALLEELKFSLDGTAVAVNESIVPKSTFGTFVLQNNMKVEVFSLVAGG